MNTKFQNLKGFRDFLPVDAAKRKWLRERLAQICELWGYSPLETPTLEPLEIFTGQIGEDEKLFFKFKDQGDREVALRYDQTVPTCRVLGQYLNNIKLPFKRYQIQTAFRAEKPQKGRYREFTQCDADIFGVKTPDADAETIALSLDIYRQLGFKKAIVRINSRTILKDLPYQAIVAIDKLKKIGQDGVIKDMENKGISADKAKEYLKYIENTKPNEEIEIILKYLKNYGFESDWFEFDPTIARSFSYSVGPIWEVVIPEAGESSVLGGERYDGMLEKFTGIDIGGTGFGLGFDRTLEALEKLALIPEIFVNSQILVTIFDKECYLSSLQVANLLRKENVSCDTYPTTDKLEKQLKYANANGFAYVIIIGPDEVTSNTMVVKNMKTRSQEKVKQNDLVNFINKLMANS